jgi:hypothetical protein
MGFLAALLTPAVLTGLVDTFIGKGVDAFKAYINKEISLEELRSRIVIALTQTITEVEKAHTDSLSKTYASFMQAATQSLLFRMVWSVVVLSQTLVLVSYQFGLVPAAPGIEWAYALVAGLLGLGSVTLRAGPGKLPVDTYRKVVTPGR